MGGRERWTPPITASRSCAPGALRRRPRAAPDGPPRPTPPRPAPPRRPSATQQIALQAAAKLARLEAASQQHAEELARAKRQLDKLQVRVRLAGQDVRRPLAQVRAAGRRGAAGPCGGLAGARSPLAVAARPRLLLTAARRSAGRPAAQVQQAVAAQAEVLARLAEEQGKGRQQVEDTQQLLGALQAVQAKQFQVTVEAVKGCQQQVARLREQQGRQQAGSGAQAGPAPAASQPRPQGAGSQQLAGGRSTPPDPWKAPAESVAA